MLLNVTAMYKKFDLLPEESDFTLLCPWEIFLHIFAIPGNGWDKPRETFMVGINRCINQLRSPIP